MAITKFMQVMFSAVEDKDEELANQVAGDIEAAKENGEVDTDEVNYKHIGDGNVMVHDKVNNEVTIAQQSSDDHETYDLIAVPDEDIEKFLHPDDSGVGFNRQIEDLQDENALNHIDGQEAEDYQAMSEENSAWAQGEASATPFGTETGDLVDGEKEFSVYTDNTAVQRIFSDQVFCERIFSEVIESEETAKVGDLKIEKIDDDTVVVTDQTTGDQAKVELDGPEMEVTELDQKEMSDYEEGISGVGSSEEHDPMFVVGVDAGNHVIVDSPVYSEEDAQELATRLSEAGVEGIEVFDDPDAARDHADMLLDSFDAECCEEPEQAEFSDYGIYMTRFYTATEMEEAHEEYMERLFSEVDPEECTAYMWKLFSETEDNSPEQDKIEDALESQEEIEEDGEIITPISDDTVIVEDKNNDEFTKITLDGSEMDTEKISEEEANELMDDADVHVESDGKEEDAPVEKEGEEEKEFSELVDPFSLDASECTAYMSRLFSEDEEGDFEDSMQADVESSLDAGEQIETDSEILTPISDDTVVIADKETGEYTKATVVNDELHTDAIDEAEAHDLLQDVKVEETAEEAEDREFSYANYTLDKYFADAVGGPQAPMGAMPGQEVIPAVMDPQTGHLVPADQMQQPELEAPVEPETMPTSVEAIEDKALVAVQAIHEAAQDAANMIQQAKDAPVPGQEEDLQEAQFSYYESDEVQNPFGTLSQWLAYPGLR